VGRKAKEEEDGSLGEGRQGDIFEWTSEKVELWWKKPCLFKSYQIPSF
jgi:hypothetical protein